MNETKSSWLDLATASDLISRRDLKPTDLVNFMLARIERINPKINAYVAVLVDASREQAAIADGEIARGIRRGPLHGLTFAVKDIIHVAGARTTGGSRSLGDYVAPRDAACVARLRAAGAILLGKLHTHELAGGITSENELFGRACNPWSPDYIPGGSSGGSAAATAAGLAHAALGTDTGGSVRIPAAFCGVVGLKGTFGTISRSGVLSRSWSMDHIGPFGRRVRDVALLFEVLAGHDPEDPYSSRRDVAPLLNRLNGDIRGLRAGVLTGDFFESNLDPEIATAFGTAVQVLKSLGVQTKPVRFELASAAHAAGTIITIVEAASSQEQVLRERPEQLGDDVRRQFQTAEFISARQYLRALRLRLPVQQELKALLNDVDILLIPTTATMPTKSSGATTSESLALFAQNTRPFSVPGFPAISIPAGFSHEGLPIGLQIIGRPFDEGTILNVGHAYELATEWHTKRPPLSI